MCLILDTLLRIAEAHIPSMDGPNSTSRRRRILPAHKPRIARRIVHHVEVRRFEAAVLADARFEGDGEGFASRPLRRDNDDARVGSGMFAATGHW